MRISADHNDPDYLPASHSALILLNGQPMRWVVSADTDKGEVVRLKLDACGRFVLDGEQWATETLQGRVAVFIPTHQGNRNTLH